MIEEVLKRFSFMGDDNEHVEFTPGQREIMDVILCRQSPDGRKRAHIMTTTQYGKSTSVGAAVLARASLFPEKWAIVAGTTDKARIIMDYAIMFALNDPIMKQQLVTTGSIERLKHEHSKERITFYRGGEIRVYSADSKNRKQLGDALMGFGAPNVIEDESALIDDDIHAKVMRMLGGSTDNFLMKIGNPFKRNHFLKSFHDDRYYKIVIDYRQAIKEGRLTEEYIAEMREQPFFDVFYEVKFPEEDAISEQGWVPLLTDTEIERALVDDPTAFGIKKLGADVAGGGRNYSQMCFRSTNLAAFPYRRREPDTMEYAKAIKEQQIKLSLKPQDIFIDRVGVGIGPYNRLNEMYRSEFMGTLGVVGVNAGEPATDPVRFSNKRAEMFWRARDWILAGGKLLRHDDWWQLTKVMYKPNHKGQLMIMPKEQMIALGIPSPDGADSFSFTFYTTDDTETFRYVGQGQTEEQEVDFSVY